MNHFLKITTAPETDLAKKHHLTDELDQQRLPQKPTGVDRIADKLLRRALQNCGDPPIRLVLPGGHAVQTNPDPLSTIRLRDYRTVWMLAVDPMFQFPEAYAEQRLEIEGPITQCLQTLHRALGQLDQTDSHLSRLAAAVRRPYANSLQRSQKNIHHHYDIGNDFYRMWLDERMLYTCAYYSDPQLSLEQAQIAKMDHVCRKLKLEAGMQVVEAGCGWGALAMHMAQHYGVHVKAYNISSQQIAWGNQQARRAGLQQRVQFIQDDWRSIRGEFDAFVSVGMLEHLGVKNYPQLGQTIGKCLKADGIGLIHTIGQNLPLALNSWIERRIFPGAYPPTLRQMMDIFETGNFSVLDVENLRLHYAQTLRHWLSRFEDSADKIRQEFGEKFVRMWRFYLAASVAAFETGNLQLFQIVFANGSSNHIPRTREHLCRCHADLRSQT